MNSFYSLSTSPSNLGRLALIFSLFSTAPAFAQIVPPPMPARSVENNVLYSEDLPAIRVRVDSAFRYVGKFDFVLKEIAYGERYVFADDKDGRIERLFIFQFEGFLPNNDHTYNYNFDQAELIEGFKFRQNTWAYGNRAGEAYVAIGSDLIRVATDSAQATVVASDLVQRSEAFDFVHDRHALMGMWVDKKGDVYVSVFSGQVVKRVSPEGDVAIVARSEGSWSASGGVVDSFGSLILLEFSTSNEVRVRRILEDGTEEIL